MSEALAKKQRRKARSMERNLMKQVKIDRRTASERGYDECVKVGTVRASKGTCCASIAGVWYD